MPGVDKSHVRYAGKDYYRAKQHYEQIPLQGVASLELAELAPDNHIVDDGEINTAQQHEQHYHYVAIVVVPEVEPVVLGRESTGRHGAHRVANGVIPVHGTQHEQRSKHNGKHHIYHPQALSRLAHARPHALMGDSCHLAVEERHSALVVEHGEHGKGEEDDSHATYPLHHRAPEQDASRQCLDVVNHRGASGGKSRHRLEESVGKPCHCSREQERYHAKD